MKGTENTHGQKNQFQIFSFILQINCCWRFKKPVGRRLKPVPKQAPVEPVTSTTSPRNSRRRFDSFLGPGGKDQRSLFRKDITRFQWDGTLVGVGHIIQH
jgi:hypothetical protein